MSSVGPSAGAGRRILVVEDEYLIADNIRMMLEDLGYDVVDLVSTIPDAITAINDQLLDAVLLDANLAGTSSAPIAVELAKHRLPFIVVTGYGSLELSCQTLQDAPRVNKPFTPDSLSVALGTVLALNKINDFRTKQ